MNITFNKSELRSDYKILDLSKNEKMDKMKEENYLGIFDFSEFENFDDFCEAVICDFENILRSPDDTTTKRMFVGDILSYFEEAKPSQFFRFLKAVKRLVRSSHTMLVFRTSRNGFGEGTHLMKTFESFFDIVLDFAPFHSKTISN